MKIYIKDKIKRGERISTYILRLYATRWGFPATYEDSECSIRDCGQGKQRSVEYLFYLIKTQRSKTTKKHFLKQLKFVVKKKGFYLLGCNNIKKTVVYDWRGKPDGNIYFDKLVYDYSRHYEEKKYKLHKGKFSIKKILKGMGYSEKQIKKELQWT